MKAFDQGLDIAGVAVRGKAGARGRRDAKQFHQWLRAMVAGANRDALVIQYGADVVGMHPVEREADDPRAVFGPEQGHSGNVSAARRAPR